MGRIESDSSAIVTQPYYKEAFPLLLHANQEDRQWKQITIPATDPHATFRLQAVNRNQEKETALVRKHVPTSIYLEQSYDLPFRIQSVLSQALHGVTNSSWVVAEKRHSDPVRAFNQYRLRGVSKEGFKSQWVYSELRDVQNDLLLYEMLYEVMDQLIGIQDQSIDFWMDYVVSDLFIKLLNDHAPLLATQINPEEKVMKTILETLHVKQSGDVSPQDKAWVALGEALQVVSDSLKEEWQEQVVSSMEEFALLMKKYQLFERYQEKAQDALSLLLTIFLEDQIEAVSQKSNLEVYVQNLEESGIYLTGVYDLRILMEHVTAVNHPSLDERFVSKFNDAVQLLSEPIVYEMVTTHSKEEVTRALRMVIIDLWGMLQTMDQTWTEILTDLSDTHELSMQAGIVEFETITEEVRIRYMLLQDLFVALLSKEDEVELLVPISLLDHVVGAWLDRRMNLQVDYLLEETVAVMKFVENAWQQAMTSSLATVQEVKPFSMSDQANATARTTTIRSPKEHLFAWMQEMATTALTKTSDSFHESKQTKLIDDWLVYASTIPNHQAESFTNDLLDRWVIRAMSLTPSLQETLLTQWMDAWYLSSDESLWMSEKIQREWLETFILEWLREKGPIIETFLAHATDPSETLFKHFPRLAYPLWMQEKMNAEVSQHPSDYYFLEGKEDVHFAMGSMDNGWPVGNFQLGTNTLKGEDTVI